MKAVSDWQYENPKANETICWAGCIFFGVAAFKSGNKSVLEEDTQAKNTGIVTKKGIQVEGFVQHGVNRVIGDGYSRAGVKPQAILDALKNPLKINDVKLDAFNRPSQRLIGQFSEVVINPETGRIISVNPTSTNKAAKLLKALEELK